MAPYAHLSQLWLAAVCLVDIANAASGHFQLSFKRPWVKGGYPGTLQDFLVPYLVEAQIGTPPQNVMLLISPTATDTWISDLTTEYTWVQNTTTTSYCDHQGYYYTSEDPEGSYKLEEVQKCVWGTFNTSQSSTYREANARYTDFDPYTFSGYATGTNFTDALVIGDLTIENYPIGLVNSASSWMGVLGLGYNYSSTTYGARYHPTILDRMVSSGQISTPAYSIWLDDAEGTSGSLLFGAIDTSRYLGDLVRLSARNPNALSGKFSVSVHSINKTIVSSTGTLTGNLVSSPNDFPIDVTIGMGELISFLPRLLVEDIASKMGATWDSVANVYTIPCDTSSFENETTSILHFGLGGEGGPVLEVRTSDLILNPSLFTSQVAGDSEYNGLEDGTCVFGIQDWDASPALSNGYSYSSSSTSGNYNLGNSILRRSYLVFDLAREEIAVAPVVFMAPSNYDANVVPFADEYDAFVPESQYFCADYEYYCPTQSVGPGGPGGPSYDDGYYYGSSMFWRKLSILLGTIFGFFVMISLVTSAFLWIRIFKKDRRTMGLPMDEEKRLMGDDGEGGGDAAAGLNSQQQQPPLIMTGAAGPLPVIREGREEEASGPTQTQTEVPPVDANHGVVAPEEQRLSAPDTISAPRSPSPLSEDGKEGARVEAASPVSVSERLGTPPADPKGKGKAAVEEIGQAR